MAVYTQIKTKDIEKLLCEYDIGSFKELKPISGGVSNSNFFLVTSKDKYLLTIIEDNPDNLNFILSFIQHLHKNNINCPNPIIDKSGNIIQTYQGKPLIIVAFLSGSHPRIITTDSCAVLGENLAKIHLAGQSFHDKTPNPHSIPKVIADKDLYIKKAENLDIICQNILKNLPTNLPKGIIHADLFPDNILFKKDHSLSGIIDFYLAGYDILAYDLAICVNAWCFEGKKINIEKLNSLVTAYQKIRSLNDAELSALQILHQGAAIRFLFLRLQIQNPAYDPQEYLDKLNYHQNNNIGDLIK